MFICSFIGILKLINCNFINFIFGMPFASCKFLEAFALITKHKTEKEARKCQRSFGEFQRGALVKTDAKFFTYTISSIMGLREERLCKTEGHRKKGEMVGLE
jgi:hypothetical protein